MNLETIIRLDTAVVNDVFRKLTTEPKALIIYWMYRNAGAYSAREIREGIFEDFGLDQGTHCLDIELIRHYFQTSLKTITQVSTKVNSGSGRSYIKAFELDLEGRPNLANLGEIAAHTIYASYTLAESFAEPIILNHIFYGYHNEENSASGSPGRIAVLLSTLNEFTELYVRDLIKLTQIDRYQAILHLYHLDGMDIVRLIDTEQTTYRLNPVRDIEQIFERNRNLLTYATSIEALSKIARHPMEELRRESICADQIISLLRKEAEGITADYIRENINLSSNGEDKNQYSKAHIYRVLANMFKLGIVQITGPGEYARAKVTPRGEKIVNGLIIPVLDAIHGDTAGLVVPTNLQIHSAIANYNSVKYT